jgi:4-hydroxybenzoate polyprenyltransferase
MKPTGVTFADWFFAARPMLHLPAWSIFLVSLHHHHLLSGESFDSRHPAMLLILSISAAASLYLNQVFDLESDSLNKKLGILPPTQNVIRTSQWLFVILNLIALVLASFISLRAVAIVIQWIVLGFLYSAPPFRLKDRPWLGIVANAYGVGLLTSVLVMPVFNMHDIGLLGWNNPQYFFFAVAGVTALTTIPDRVGDASVGKRTVAVLYGPRLAAALASLLLCVAGYFSWESDYQLQTIIAAVSCAFAAISAIANAAPLYRFAAKFPIIMLTVLAGWYYPAYLVFIIALLLITRLYYRRRHGQTYPQLA